MFRYSRSSGSAIIRLPAYRLAVAAALAVGCATCAGAALAAATPPPVAPVNGTGPTPSPIPSPAPTPPAPPSPPAPTPTPSGAGPTVMCHFVSGPKAGKQARVSTPVPTPVGGACQDGAGSVGVVAGRTPAPAAAP